MNNQIILGKILFELGDSGLLACRKVTQSWKSAIDDPVIWLRKLNSIGQPTKIDCEWKKIIQRCIQIQKPIEMLTPCLMKTYFTNVNLSDENLENGNQESKNLWRQVFLGFPPIHWAIENKQLEVVKLICNFDPDYNRRISCEPACSKFFYVPFLTAISYNYSDIVKWMVTNDKVIT